MTAMGPRANGDDFSLSPSDLQRGANEPRMECGPRPGARDGDSAALRSVPAGLHWAGKAFHVLVPPCTFPPSTGAEELPSFPQEGLKPRPRSL